jgi:hypothetical protein
VFTVAPDETRLPQWMPPPVGVRPVGDGQVHADGEARDVPADGLVRLRPEQPRVE